MRKNLVQNLHLRNKLRNVYRTSKETHHGKT